jgi:hypothetical protein
MIEGISLLEPSLNRLVANQRGEAVMLAIAPLWPSGHVVAPGL